MILGMSLKTFTFVHVVISLVGIMTGLVLFVIMGIAAVRRYHPVD